MLNNGDTQKEFTVGTDKIRGVGSFHKTLPHNEFGEVDSDAFEALVDAGEGLGDGYGDVPGGEAGASALINPQAGFAHDRLTPFPTAFSNPPAPTVLSVTTAAEMTELYWMALLRDTSFDKLESKAGDAADEINTWFAAAVSDTADPGHLRPGSDIPGSATTMLPITVKNIFRVGLPDEEHGPLISQFFIRDANYGTQAIDQMQLPYAKEKDYLTTFASWLHAQRTGQGDDGNAYPRANEAKPEYYENDRRYISTLRDIARFVNKDALHQAYFTATLLLLSGGAKWTAGNPYRDKITREAGFGTLGGPHILALVSEVATRALKIVWNQKWRVHLRLRPEAYGGLVHVQNIGVGTSLKKRAYGLPSFVATTKAAKEVRARSLAAGEETLLLPLAFTSGSPAHPSYGAGHATVAGACVTVLKAFFETEVPIQTLVERARPYDPPTPFKTYVTGVGLPKCRKEIPAGGMTIEGELNKLAANVAMGRSIGGVHWRTDNTRSLLLGESIAAKMLADITTDLTERPIFKFRSFARKADGKPKEVVIEGGRVTVDGIVVDPVSAL